MMIIQLYNYYNYPNIQAKTWSFDKNFFNFEDMDVLEKFLDPNDTQIWTDTYGVDYAAM